MRILVLGICEGRLFYECFDPVYQKVQELRETRVTGDGSLTRLAAMENQGVGLEELSRTVHYHN